MNEQRLMTILLAPHVSEKTTMIGDKFKQVAFNVVRDANKCEIKRAVEKLFDVKVASVRVLNTHAKKKRFGRREGVRQAQKKAYVTLEEGYDINFTGM